MNLEDKIKAAIRLHQLGSIGVAKKIYNQVLNIDPRNFNALHMLGVIAFEEKKYELSIKLINKAVSSYGGSAIAFFNLGNAYLNIKDL